MIHLDTSTLIEVFGSSAPLNDEFVARWVAGEPMNLSSIALLEWLRGTRTAEERLVQESFLPAAEVIPFGPDEAVEAARICRHLRGVRHRLADITIAACAITHDAELWTTNPQDFEDIPGLRLVGRGSVS